MSVLKEADPKSLDDLYSDDPLNLTDNDLDRLVADWQAKRHLWEREEKASQSEGRTRKKSYKEAPKELTLSLLGLGKVVDSD